MRWIFLLLLVILVVAAVDAHRKHKSKKGSKKGGFKFNFRFPKLKGKFRSPKSRPHSRKHSHKVSQKISFSYNINIKHNYKSEVHCSKHCVPDKAYWQNNHCLCHSGLAGAGDLCCTNPNDHPYTCTVRCDPYVHSYLNQSATVFNPCGQVLAVIDAQTKSHKKCHVTIRSADVIEQGIFVTNQVEISYKIGSYDREYVILDGYRYYNSMQHSWQSMAPDCSTTCFSIHGEKVEVLQDKQRRVWTVDACGTVVNFRRDTRGGKPGVCISSKNRFSDKSCDRPQENVCNLLEVPIAPYETKAIYYLAKSFEHKEYENLRLNCAYGGLCRKITKTFKECCPTRRAGAMNVCARILMKDFRSCAFVKDGLDGAKLFELFGKCLKAYCDGDQQWCYNEKATTKFLHCTIPTMHCCDFSKHGSGGGGSGGGSSQQQQQVAHIKF